MIKDVKSYFNTVASRLSQAFAVEDFDTEQELEFWSLAAEHISRSETPAFRDMVGWIDLLFRAPVHFIYLTDREDKMKLYRRQVVSENLDRMISLTEDSNDQSSKRKNVEEFEERLSSLEPKITFNQRFKEFGTSSFTIGQCQHIPIYRNDELWALYCVGPYVQIPDVIVPRLSIVGRILSKWLVAYHDKESESLQGVKHQVDTELGGLGTGGLNVQGIAKILLGYAIRRTDTGAGFMLAGDHKGEHGILSALNVPDDLLNDLRIATSKDAGRSGVENVLDQRSEFLKTKGLHSYRRVDVGTGSSQCTIWLFNEGETTDDFLSSETGETLEVMLSELINYQDSHVEFSKRLLKSYYSLLRDIEKGREKTLFHTPRVEAFCDKFAGVFGLDESETDQLLLTARLHDIGYVGSMSTMSKRSVGSELDHPLVGKMMVDALPIDEVVKTGIATHHEWIDGSGTPEGLKEEDIPWTGKIVAVFEFVVQFIESHRHNSSVSSEKRLEQLTEALVERTDKQFDIILIPSVIELLNSLGWDGCCRLGESEL